MYILFLTVKFYYISRIKIYQFAPTVTFLIFLLHKKFRLI